MACSNGCNCLGSLHSRHGRGCARRINNHHTRNSYTALNTSSACGRYLNYPFYTGACPDECGCYHHGCNAGVNTQYARRHGSSHCPADSCGANNCDCDNNCDCRDTCDDCFDTCDDCHSCDNHCECDECDDCACDVYGVFAANAPMCVSRGCAIPLRATDVSTDNFAVSGGTITILKPGRYLAVCAFQAPGGANIDTVVSMNVNGIAENDARLNVHCRNNSKVLYFISKKLFNATNGTTIDLLSSENFGISGNSGQNLVSLIIVKV